MKGVRWFVFGSLIFAYLCLMFLSVWIDFEVDASTAVIKADAFPLADNPNPPAEVVKLIFIHHSVGESWLEDGYGGLGVALRNAGYFVSDTNYDWGTNSIGSRTDITDWPEWFRGPNSTTYLSELYAESGQNSSYSRLASDPGGENEIVMFKSCYPNSDLEGNPNDPPAAGDGLTVSNVKYIYNDLLNYFVTRPDKLFIVITAPALYETNTDPAYAANARAFNNWLMNDWLDGYAYNNVAVFNFYNVMTSNGGDANTNDLGQESGNHHRWWNGTVQHIQTVASNTLAYPTEDNHPSQAGTLKATGEFVQLLNVFYNRWQGSSGPPLPTGTVLPTPETQSSQAFLPLILRDVPQITPQPTPTSTLGPTPTATIQPTPSTGACPSYPSDAAFVTGTSVYALPDFTEYSARQWFTDPTFDTCVVRATDRDTDMSADDISTGLGNEYARVQSFNSDGTRLLVRGTDGSWYLYNAQTLQPIAQLPLEVDPRWDANNPELIYYSADTCLISYNVQTEQNVVLHEFSDDFPGQILTAVWMRYEGRPSRDTRYWGLMAQDENWDTVAFLVYDRQTDVVTIRDMSSISEVADGIDHVTISPLGDYFIASFDHYCDPGQLGTDANPCGMMVYDSDLTNGRGLLRIVGHYDPVLDAQGREVVIFQDIDTDYISMLDLETGTVTPLWEIDYSYTGIGFHFSGLAYDAPGWAVVSTHDDDPVIHTWMDDQVFLVELKANGRVVRLAHTHSIVDESQPSEYYYWAEPHASTNPDLTRIVFTTNWGRYDTGEVEMYMIALPQDWRGRLK